MSSTRFILIVILLTSFSCQKIVVYPDEPSVSFKDLIIKDSTDILGNPVKYVKLTFNLIDGNGDVGLDEADTIGPFHRDSAYYYNLIIREHEKIGDEYVEVGDVEFPRNYRLPDLSPKGQNKTLIADVSVEIEYRYSDLNPLPFTEFKYFFYIVDRALNKSNTDTSTLVVF
ncbi:MAG: hypothetical protein J7L96_10895 [Bacteroidales bacterium]|nr:hypothetical protein [Bacteroidales bacterium]